jgi:hypothetical protein
MLIKVLVFGMNMSVQFIVILPSHLRPGSSSLSPSFSSYSTTLTSVVHPWESIKGKFSIPFTMAKTALRSSIYNNVLCIDVDHGKVFQHIKDQWTNQSCMWRLQTLVKDCCKYLLRMDDT